MKMKRTVLVLVALAMLAAMPALAQSVISAADREAMRGFPDKWGFSVGSFWQTFDTKVRLNGKTGEGTEINFEKDLGLGKNLTAFQFTGFWRFGDHGRIDLNYVPWNREHTRTIDQEIQWGDVTYDAGATLNTKAKIQLLNIIYRYSFINNGKVTFGLNGGVSAIWSNLELSGEGTISGGGTASGTIAKKSDVILPIPVIGVHFDMLLTKRLLWRAEGNFFAANVSGYNGNINVLGTSIEYFLTKNIALGAGFASDYYNIKKTGDNGGDLRVKYGFSGVTAYAQFQF
jgi:hypothetical protein